MSKNKNNSNETTAYTPGLKVKSQIIVRKTRKLPLKGEVLVKVGDKVKFNTVVAKGNVPGDPYSITGSTLLGVEDSDLPRYVCKKIGQTVKKDEICAQRIMLFGLMKNFVRSPIDGTLESVSDLTGSMIFKEHPVPVEIESYIPGTVVEILPNEGAVIETYAAYINGIFGIGGESHGKIEIVTNSPDEILLPEIITFKNKGNIVVGGAFAPIETIKKAIEIGVVGMIVGGINQKDIIDFLGYEIGVAITGQEDISLTLIITEGFGKMGMSQKTFNLLKKFNGSYASINGATQIRAGVIRPEIIIPHEPFVTKEEQEMEMGLIPGTLVRIIRDPFFGKIGTVVSLPVNLQVIETNSEVRVIVIEIENGRCVTVPRANVEIIEE